MQLHVHTQIYAHTVPSLHLETLSFHFWGNRTQGSQLLSHCGTWHPAPSTLNLAPLTQHLTPSTGTRHSPGAQERKNQMMKQRLQGMLGPPAPTGLGWRQCLHSAVRTGDETTHPQLASSVTWPRSLPWSEGLRDAHRAGRERATGGR